MNLIKQLIADLYLMFLIAFSMAVFGILLLIGFHLLGLVDSVILKLIYVEMNNEDPLGAGYTAVSDEDGKLSSNLR